MTNRFVECAYYFYSFIDYSWVEEQWVTLKTGLMVANEKGGGAVYPPLSNMVVL